MAFSETMFAPHLRELGIEEGLISILTDLAEVEVRIYRSFSLRDMVKGGETNVSGDVQSSLDVTSERMIAETLDANTHVCSHLSEECEEFRTCSATGTYFVAYDPYDGGSIGDADVTVGSIFGIWSAPPSLGDAAGKNLVCGAYVLWGPQLAIAVATEQAGVWWYEHDGADFRLVSRLDFDAQGLHKGVFAPGDCPTLLENEAYEALFKYALASKLRLRYAGSCMTDTHHILHKKGMFWYPPGKKGGLRLMYEAAPLGFVVNAAGGIAVDHTGRAIADVPITDWHQRTSFLFSSPQFAEEAIRLILEVGKG